MSVICIDHKEYLKVQIRKNTSFVCNQEFRYLVKNNIWKMKYIASKPYAMNKKYKKFQDLVKNKLQINNNTVCSREPKNQNTLDCYSINYCDVDFSLKPVVSVKQLSVIFKLKQSK